MQIGSSDELLSDYQNLVHNCCYDYISVVKGLEPNLPFLLY